MPLDLLLADLRDGRARRLSAALGRTAQAAPAPAQRARDHLAVPSHSDDLTREKWGVVLPASQEGEERLAWIRPLLELRARQCGLAGAADVPVLRAPLGMRQQEARVWRVNEYDTRRAELRPGYLLLLGDLWELSHELQLELMVSASVGRLCFTTLDGRPDRAGYERYCAKLVAAEATQASWSEQAQLLFYSSRDGSAAVEESYTDLLRSCYQEARAGTQLAAQVVPPFGAPGDPQWDAPPQTSSPSPHAPAASGLMSRATAAQPAVLLSVTHGAGVDDPQLQRNEQGILVLRGSSPDQRMQVRDARYFEQRFLPRGFWFAKACFSAGTPATSVYEPWLATLQRLDVSDDDPREALRYLARDQRPFIARLPQVALANPEGPLGVLGHVDLAWSYGERIVDEDNPAIAAAEPGAHYDVLRTVANGHRFGAAVASLSQKAMAVGAELAQLYAARDLAPAGAKDRHAALRAWVWMQYLDLSGYILLGDPAAQLPTAAARAIAQQAKPSATAAPSHSQSRSISLPLPPSPSPPSSPSPHAQAAARLEEAVLAVLRREAPAGAIAQKAGLATAHLHRCVEAYRAAGRAALAAALETAPERLP